MGPNPRVEPSTTAKSPKGSDASSDFDWLVYDALIRRAHGDRWAYYPYFSSKEISRELAVSRVKVWRRIAHLRQTGFLLNYLLFPNPTLLNAGVLRYSLEVPRAEYRISILDSLEAIEEIFHAQISSGSRVPILVAFENRQSLRRCLRSISHVDGVERILPSGIAWLPTTACVPGLIDWRIIRALLQDSTQPIGMLATRLGISAKTVARRLHTLVTGRTVLGILVEDLSAFPATIAAMNLDLTTPIVYPQVVNLVHSSFPDTIDLPIATRPPGEKRRSVRFLLRLQNAFDATRLCAEFSHIPGVERAFYEIGGMCRGYPRWFCRRVDKLLDGGLETHARRYGDLRT